MYRTKTGAKSTYRECSEKQSPTPKGVDGIEGRESKQPVDDAKTERSSQGRGLGEVGLDEDLGAVVCDGVDAAELLHEHDCYTAVTLEPCTAGE